MSYFNIFENLRLTGKFWRNVAPYISGYLLVFIFILFGVWIAYGVDKNLMAGFTLFNFFPGWLRFVCLDLIASALIGIPLGIIAGFFISTANDSLHEDYIGNLRDRLEIKCIDCSNEIKPQGDFTSGQLDIRCPDCRALMTITIEEGQFKKLILKKHGIYNY